jgi:carbon monoxide dehydrogenase subunit G
MQARGSILINRPPETAFAFVASPSHDAVWRSHLIASSGKVTGVGDAVAQTYSYEGRTQAVNLEVSEFEPPGRLAFVMHEPVRVRLAFQFRPEAGGTRVSAMISSAVTGAAALFESRIQAEAERVIHTDLQRLKVALEEAEEA